MFVQWKQAGQQLAAIAPSSSVRMTALAGVSCQSSRLPKARPGASIVSRRRLGMAARRLPITTSIAFGLIARRCSMPARVAVRSKVRRVLLDKPEKADRAANTADSSRSRGNLSRNQISSDRLMALACLPEFYYRPACWRIKSGHTGAAPRHTYPNPVRLLAPLGLTHAASVFVLVFSFVAWLYPLSFTAVRSRWGFAHHFPHKT